MNDKTVWIAVEEIPYSGDNVHAEYFDTEEQCCAWIDKLAHPLHWRTIELTYHRTIID